MKMMIPLAGLLLAVGLLASLLMARPARGGAPTAPPPPRETATRARRPEPHPTGTQALSTSRKQGTPTNTPTASPTETTTLTATTSPTASPSPTPTSFPNLHVLVYLDMNGNDLFDPGEGVSDLLILVNASSWEAQLILGDGEAWLPLPPDLAQGAEVQVGSPYLHWSDLLRAPRPGEVLQATLRLEQPQFPVSLP